MTKAKAPQHRQDRWRGTEQEARSIIARGGPKVAHLLNNQDGTYSVMSHIVCDWCDYCDTQGDCRPMGNRPVEYEAVPYKPDPYANNP